MKSIINVVSRVPMSIEIPDNADTYEVVLGPKTVKLTSLRKVFWPDSGFTKRDMLSYYVRISAALLPHLKDRAMVMKRYPNGIAGEFFFMKRAPAYRPAWLKTCSIEHKSGSVIDFPVVQDLPSLLWLVNQGCIDLNPWYSRCDDTDRPDFLHFDLDPVPPAAFSEVRQAALLLRDYFSERKVESFPKTSGSRGIHVYIPIQRGPLQKEVWAKAKSVAREIAGRHSALLTAEYRIAKRPAGRILIDYNQNAWGRTLASAYSVRAKPGATVSAPMAWAEVERNVDLDEFRMTCMPARVTKLGDLFKGVLGRKRYRLESIA